MFSFQNGTYVASEELALPVQQDILGTFRGYRIFTVCKTVGYKVIHLNDHIDRLFLSAEKINMTLPYTKDTLKQELEAIKIGRAHV